MILCPTCSQSLVRKSGIIKREIMTKRGKVKLKLQAYRCRNSHFFTTHKGKLWDDSFIETVVYIYLRCLSLNTTIDIVRMFYEQDLLTKRLVLEFIEIVADVLPTIDDIDRLFNPVRSGYLAFDGVWFQFGKDQIVLLVCFDPDTFDIISARWEKDETQEGYERLITETVNKIGIVKVKGAYGDGDKGLIKALKHLLPTVPFQICVFHKEMKMGTIVPIKSVHVSKKLTPYQKHDIKVFQLLFRKVIYAKTKDESVKALEQLKKYAKTIQNEKFLRAYRSLVYNFKYTLTHFDYPHMRRDNNLIECFNSCLKPRLRLMKGFKKEENLNRYLKLFLLEFRFHALKESGFKERNESSPLELTDVYLPKYYNFLTFLRTRLNLSYQLKKS
jgi:hypothetical protein